MGHPGQMGQPMMGQPGQMRPGMMPPPGMGAPGMQPGAPPGPPGMGPGMGMQNARPGMPQAPMQGAPPGIMGVAPSPNGAASDLTSKAGMVKMPPPIDIMAPIAMPVLTFSLSDGKELGAANSKSAAFSPPGPLSLTPAASPMGTIGKGGGAPVFSKQGPPGPPLGGPPGPPPVMPETTSKLPPPMKSGPAGDGGAFGTVLVSKGAPAINTVSKAAPSDPIPKAPQAGEDAPVAPWRRNATPAPPPGAPVPPAKGAPPGAPVIDLDSKEAAP